jgi:hypothetical protein
VPADHETREAAQTKRAGGQKRDHQAVTELDRPTIVPEISRLDRGFHQVETKVVQLFNWHDLAALVT